MKIEVDGLRELNRSLRRVQKDYPKEMQSIHEAIADPVAEAARGKARRKSGDMAGSIRPSATQTMARVAAGGYGVVYAGVQHWGWPAHNITPNMFLVDAINDKSEASLDLYLKMTDDFLEAVWESI